jgi:energy-coupling factor transporter ATP-binding protein EcfA2
MLGDKRFLRTFKVRNILSFGPESPEIELQSLNVLIGPNGAGKSNLIETIALLQAAPGHLLAPIQTGGGIGEWLWKGGDSAPTAEIDVTVSYPQGMMPLRHRLEFTMVGQRAELADEAIENAHPSWGEQNVYFYYRYQHGHPVLNVKAEASPPDGPVRRLRREDLPVGQSVLSQRKDPKSRPVCGPSASDEGLPKGRILQGGTLVPNPRAN